MPQPADHFLDWYTKGYYKEASSFLGHPAILICLSVISLWPAL